MAELTQEMQDVVNATVRVVLLEMIRDMPLRKVLELVYRVRWGALGRALDEKRIPRPSDLKETPPHV